MIHEFVSSFLLIAASEFGDKTQMLAAALSLRYGRPKQILAASFVASLANHWVVAQVGAWTGMHFAERQVSLTCAAIFTAIALVTVLSKNGKSVTLKVVDRPFSFLGIALLMFIAEIGDKTQLATATLAARYDSVFAVTIASSLAILAADAVAIYFGFVVGRWIRWKHLKWVSAATFLTFAIYFAVGTTN